MYIISNRPIKTPRIFLLLFVFSASALMQNCIHTTKIHTPNLVWPLPPDSPRIKLISSFSSPEEINIRLPWYKKLHSVLTGKKSESIRIQNPYGIWVDRKKSIYVTDSVLRAVVQFNKETGQFKIIKLPDEKSFISPIGITGDNKDRIYVTDSALCAVFVFRSNGRYIFSFGNPDLKRPTGLTFDPEKTKLFIVDTLSHSIKIFTPDGEYLSSFGNRGDLPGEFNFPTSIFCDTEGRLYIGDSMNFKIQIFDAMGNYISHFGQLGDGAGYLSQIKGVAADSKGHIYVTDAQFDVIQIFDTQGNYLMNFGSPGIEPGQFQFPAGIFIDKTDRIYVTDRLNQRIQIFEYLKGEQCE